MPTPVAPLSPVPANPLDSSNALTRKGQLEALQGGNYADTLAARAGSSAGYLDGDMQNAQGDGMSNPQNVQSNPLENALGAARSMMNQRKAGY